MLGRDGIAGLICLGLSIALLVMTRGLPQSALVPIGPDFYPRIVLVIMAALGDRHYRRAGDGDRHLPCL